MQNRIREIRRVHGWTMKQLGQKIGVAESTISQYETGKRQPDNEALLKLAEALGVTVGYLLGAEEKAPTDDGERKSDIETAKIALFGGDGEVTDEMWDEAIFAAKLIKERYRRKKE